MKQEALDRRLWRTRFGRGFGSIVKSELRYESFVIAYEEAVLRKVIGSKRESGSPVISV